jgi:hypothetical protein
MIFGQLPIEREVLATTLVFELTDEVRRQGKEADWTRILKTILRRMGQERGYKVNPDPDWEPPQFLLDLIWWKNESDMDIVLGVESEWGGNNAVCYDFGKLLTVKAPLKLLIFERQTRDTTKIIEERYMQKFTHHVEGEHYLLLEFDTRNREAHPFYFPVPSSGKLESATFQRFPSIVWKE